MANKTEEDSVAFGSGSRKSAEYRQLHQSDSDISDTDEDEKVIFRKPGDLELNLVPDYNLKHSSKREHARARCRKLSAVSCLVVVVLLSLVAVIAKYRWKEHGMQNVLEKCESCDWNVTLKGFTVENGLVLFDVDGDGKDDLIFSTVVNRVMQPALAFSTQNVNYGSMHEFCNKLGHEYPCTGMMFALRGYDGKELWRMRVRGILFNLNCDEFDLDRDGRTDCIGTGRMGGTVAFNPYKGERLWIAESDSHLQANWNTYQARPLPDWDGDGVPEVLIANGGDPTKAAEEHNRKSGRLLILSGASGQPLGDRYLDMPDDKETYMTPVYYRQTDGSPTYILFGSGGETVPGDFMGISVTDFCHYIFGTEFPKCPPRDNLTWSHLEKDKNGIFVIFRGEKKGVMVPPVIVDVNRDGIMDVVVSAFDGAVILLDGKTMRPQWKANFTNLESYSNPAPGYFDDDDVLDFMLHWNIGNWEEQYEESFTVVISGKNGEELWRSKSVKDIQASNLVISTNQTQHDFFIFRQQKLAFGNQTQTRRSRRHGGMHAKKPQTGGDHMSSGGFGPTPEVDLYDSYYYTKCSELNLPTTQEVFLLDRLLVNNPLKILELPSTEYYYNPSDVENTVNEYMEVVADGTMDGAIGKEVGLHKSPEGNHIDETEGLPQQILHDHELPGDLDDHDKGEHNLEPTGHDGGQNVPVESHNQGTSGEEDETEDDENNLTEGQGHRGETEVQGQPADGERLKRETSGVRRRSSSQFCSYLIPESGTTGAVGDVDGDGLIDYISILPNQADGYDTKYNNVGLFYSDTVIHKISVEKLMQNQQLKAVAGNVKTSQKSEGVSIPVFLPAKQQKWTKYMGAKGNNWFT